MLYPNIQKLTNDEVNKYALVIATAKCARYITDKNAREREKYEVKKETGDRFSKEVKPDVSTMLISEKSVSSAIDKIDTGECKIIL